MEMQHKYSIGDKVRLVSMDKMGDYVNAWEQWANKIVTIREKRVRENPRYTEDGVLVRIPCLRYRVEETRRALPESCILGLASECPAENPEDDKEWVECWDCEELLLRDDAIFDPNSGHWFCQKHFDERFAPCECCGVMVDCEELIWIPSDDIHICGECLDREYVQCECCEEWFHADQDGSLHHSDGNEHYCASCVERYEYVVCDDCGRIGTLYEMYTTGDGLYYCKDCWDDRCVIHEYGYKPDALFHAVGELRPSYAPWNDLYLGVELELEVDGGDEDERDNLAMDLHGQSQDEELFYLKKDGSLDTGLEIVSHPCPLAYHQQCFPWERLAQICSAYGYTSHDAGTCGLHVHASRRALGTACGEYSEEKEESTIAKIILLFDRMWPQIVRFSRRKPSELRWGKRPVEDFDVKDTDLDIADKLEKYRSLGRYQAVNIQNTRTVEFRVFRGTLNMETFYATLDFVDLVCNYCRDTDLEVLVDATWADLLAYRPLSDDLRGYLERRHLLWKEATSCAEDEDEDEYDGEMDN